MVIPLVNPFISIADNLISIYFVFEFDFRNPWGHYSWRGDWSDDSKLWTDDLRDILMPHGGSEGVFWISFEDVLK